MKLFRYAIVLIIIMLLTGCKVKTEQIDLINQTGISTTDSVSAEAVEDETIIQGKTTQQKTETTQTNTPIDVENAEPIVHKVTFLELGSKTCIPCKMMQPIMKEIAEEYIGVVKVEFHDLGEDRQIGSKYNIRVMPTQVFLDSEGKEFFRHEGFYPKDELSKMLNEHLAKLPK